jgi:hypothetical protein
VNKVFLLLSLSYLCTLNLLKANAQESSQSVDSLYKQIDLYRLKKSSSVLFTCFDKTVYVNNENVWLTSYLLDYNKQTNDPTILSIVLLNNFDKSIVLKQQFSMANGLSFGHVIIPDSLAPGNYSFITYTNVIQNGIPDDVFVQQITIKSTSESPFLTSLKSVDTPATETKKIVLEVKTASHIPINDATVSWRIGDTAGKIIAIKGKGIIDGLYSFSVSRKQIISGNYVMQASVSFNKEVRQLTLHLSPDEPKLSIKFYPEGGSLVHGTLINVGWEARTEYGAPVKIKAVLYKDNIAIDTLQNDRYGLGKFTFIPMVLSRYHVQVIGDANDNHYLLPAIVEKGPVLSIKKAIVNDSLQIKLSSKYPQKFTVIIHNFTRIFYAFVVQAISNGKIALVNLADVPKGLAAVTVLDSLQKPRAERIFFAHYDRRNALTVATDQQEYSLRQKVQLKLKLAANPLDSIKGIVTIACVQSSRREVKNSNDIESYRYLISELGALPAKENYMGRSDADLDYLEKLLLIKGWRKYNWKENQGNANDTLNRGKQVNLSGNITRYGHPLKNPLNLMVKTDSATTIATTDNKGNFQLDRRSVLSAEKRKVYLILNVEKSDGYEIKMNNEFENITNRLTKELNPIDYNSLASKRLNNDSLIINDLGRTVHLHEVKIVGRKDDLYKVQPVASSALAKDKNECGDYVCMFDILNCANHKDDERNRPPVIGESYKYEGTYVVYKGCSIEVPSNTMTTAFIGINYSKEFYGPDYSRFNPSEPEYLSTIYWKRLCFINSKQDTELSFYTSDIIGSFDIVIQGVSSNGLIYEKRQFYVKKNNR